MRNSFSSGVTEPEYWTGQVVRVGPHGFSVEFDRPIEGLICDDSYGLGLDRRLHLVIPSTSSGQALEGSFSALGKALVYNIFIMLKNTHPERQGS